MASIEELIISIKDKASGLKLERNELKKKLEQLNAKIVELNEIINQQKDYISKLESEQFINKLTGNEDSGLTPDSRQRLDDLLKEINKCIEIISD